MIYIYALNIKLGGGAILLSSILSEYTENEEVTVYLNTNILDGKKLSNKIHVVQLNPSLFSQLYNEWRLKNITKLGDIAIYFSSKPPLFKIKARTFTFVQNRYVVDYGPSSEYKLLEIIKFYILRKWFLYFNKNSDYFIVQNNSMYTLLSKLGIHPERIIEKPFAPKRMVLNVKKIELPDIFNFIYPANYLEHKNHLNLINAWLLLAADGFYPALYLTITNAEYEKILMKSGISSEKIDAIKIYTLGNLDFNNLYSLYGSVNALVYPSLFESFGLPIIEAHGLGLDIICGEIDYVRDLPVSISETFDPKSVISIARAICRYCHYEKNSKLEVIDSSEFLGQLIDRFKN